MHRRDMNTTRVERNRNVSRYATLEIEHSGERNSDDFGGIDSDRGFSFFFSLFFSLFSGFNLLLINLTQSLCVQRMSCNHPGYPDFVFVARRSS